MSSFTLLLFQFIFVFTLIAQGGDDCATALANPITIPFNSAGTTCGATNDINALTSNCTNLGAVYTTSNDWFYYFCVPQNGTLLINISGFIPCPAYPSISVWTGCPTSSNCVIAATTTGPCQLGLSFNVITSQCYYLMIDNWPTPSCFGYNLSISYLPIPPINSQCVNTDFELGNFNGWFGTNGIAVCGSSGDPHTIYSPFAVGFPSPQHKITSGSSMDPCGNFPQVCPGGNYSVRLGDSTVGSIGGGSIEQSYTVQWNTTSFTYKYAAIVQDGSHVSYEQPFFKVEMLDQSDQLIPNGQYLAVGGPSMPGFFPTPCQFAAYYKPWTTVNVDLSSYVGQNVKIKFTSGDCCFGGHFSYAYVDSDCSIGPTSINENVVSISLYTIQYLTNGTILIVPAKELLLNDRTIELYNVTGKLLTKKSFSEDGVILSPQDLTPGFYFFRISSGSTVLGSDRLALLPKH